MNATLFKLFFSVAVMVCCLEGSGCTNTQTAKKAALPQGTTVLVNEENPTSSTEAPIDTETFTAFCDRA